MKKLTAMIVLLMSASGAFAQATTEANTSTVKQSEVAPRAEKKDIDDEITNAKLRASTGAKSTFSFQSEFGYNGGSLQRPLAKERPQLSPGAVGLDPAKLSGSISMKMRATDHDNINVGVGVGLLTPGYSGQKGQMENPYISYGRAFKSGDVQNVFSAAVQKYTADKAVNTEKLNYELDVSHTLLTSVGSTRWEAGIVGEYTHENYKEFTGGLTNVVALFPFAEYAITEKYSFRTVYRGLSYYELASNRGTFEHDDPTQSMGIGVALTRDIYIYPNVQWVWGEVRDDRTNVAISANINL